MAALSAGGLESPVALCCWDVVWQQVGVRCFVGSELSRALSALSALGGHNAGASQLAAPALPVSQHIPTRTGRTGPGCTCPQHLCLS